MKPHPAEETQSPPEPQVTEDVVQAALQKPLVTHGPFVRLPDEVIRAGLIIEFMEAIRNRR